MKTYECESGHRFTFEETVLRRSMEGGTMFCGQCPNDRRGILHEVKV